MRFYCEEAEAVLRDVDSTSEGLTSAEAEKRLAAYGKNKLAEGKKDSLIKRFFQQMGDPMIIILLVAAAISGVLAVVQGESFADVIIILAVVIINAVLGVYQESKAEKAIEALQQMSAATSKVLRDGKMVTIHSEDLVVGDVVILEAGDAIPADGRILTSASMKIEEAALTGESVPVSKFIDIINLAPDDEGCPARRPQEHGVYGLHGRLRPRHRRHHRHRHGHRDGQDRGRPLQCRAGPDPAADQAQPALKDPHLARARHLRHHFRGAAPARGRLQL